MPGVWVRVFLSILALILFPAMAIAGPWPRAEGETFLSFSVERDRAGNSHTGLYAEYGWSARRTLGLEIGHTNVGETSLLIWTRKAIGNQEGPNRFAFASGIGVVEQDGEYLPLGTFDFSWGRGIERLPGGGWISADGRIKIAGKPEKVTYREGMSTVEVAYLTPETTAKLDVTLGFKPWERTMFINQLRMEQRKNEGFSAKLATSLVYEIKNPAKIEFGLVTPISGPGERAFKIGTWLEF